jgi:transposase
MFELSPRPRLFLHCAATDMRKGFDGLSGIVRSQMRGDPLSGDVFVFVNRSRTHVKLLYFDVDGFVLFYKRLEQGTFAFTPSLDGARQIRRDELMLMLEGIDRATTRRRLRYSRN